MTDASRSRAAARVPAGTAAKWRARVVGTLIVVAGLGACASTPEPMLIALPSAAQGARAARVGAASPPEPPRAGVLLVRRLSLPEYMISRRVRYSTDTARLAEWPDAYWAERIEVGMARELVAALREALPGWQVCDASCGDAAPDFTLKVDLQRLDVLRGAGHIVAMAQTQLRPAKPGAASTSPPPAISQTFVQPLPADSAQGQARAMTDLLRSIAEAGAAAVLRARATLPAGASTP